MLEKSLLQPGFEPGAPFPAGNAFAAPRSSPLANNREMGQAYDPIGVLLGGSPHA